MVQLSMDGLVIVTLGEGRGNTHILSHGAVGITAEMEGGFAPE